MAGCEGALRAQTGCSGLRWAGDPIPQPPPVHTPPPWRRAAWRGGCGTGPAASAPCEETWLGPGPLQPCLRPAPCIPHPAPCTLRPASRALRPPRAPEPSTATGRTGLGLREDDDRNRDADKAGDEAGDVDWDWAGVGMEMGRGSDGVGMGLVTVTRPGLCSGSARGDERGRHLEAQGWPWGWGYHGGAGGTRPTHVRRESRTLARRCLALLVVMARYRCRSMAQRRTELSAGAQRGSGGAEAGGVGGVRTGGSALTLHGGGALAVVQDGQLPEDITRPQRAELPAPLRHAQLPLCREVAQSRRPRTCTNTRVGRCTHTQAASHMHPTHVSRPQH